MKRAPAAQPGSTTFTLDQAVQYALAHYPSVRGAVEQVTASTAGVDVAKGAYLPRFDAMWQTNRATANNVVGQVLPQSVMPSLSGPVLSTTSADSAWGSAVGGLLSWEPLDLGLRGAQIRESETAVARARADEALTRLSVAGAVADAFLVLVSAQQSAIAADADLQRRGVLARAAHALADNQLRPGADASRADAELAAARTRVIRARQALAIAGAGFARLLGMAAGHADADAGRLLGAVPPAGSAGGSPLPHPLLQSSEAAVEASRAREAVLAKANLPRVFLQSSVFARGSGAQPDGSTEGGASGLWFDRGNWAVGVQVVVPNVFEFSTLRARRAAAGAVTRVEAARYEEATLSLSAQQRAADAMVDGARAIAENTPVQLASARQSEAQARARYDTGLAGIAEVADAQALLAAAEYQDAVARVDVWRALFARAVARGDFDAFMETVRGAGVQ